MTSNHSEGGTILAEHRFKNQGGQRFRFYVSSEYRLDAVRALDLARGKGEVIGALVTNWRTAFDKCLAQTVRNPFCKAWTVP
jgi:hypothetical protein